MYNKNERDASPEKSVSETVKNWLIPALIFFFVLLYAAAFFSFLKPVSDTSTLLRIEPLIFIIIGYYFGRLPADRKEKALEDEINRQTQKADAAQYAKEKVQQEREALEEKIKNARTTLVLIAASKESESKNEFGTDKAINMTIKAAMSILDS